VRAGERGRKEERERERERERWRVSGAADGDVERRRGEM
jgi:hypothetical protein